MQTKLRQFGPNEVAAVFDRLNSIRADYNISKNTRHTRTRHNLISRGAGANYHIRSDYDFYKGIEKARDMDRNDAIIGQMITRATYNEIQDGFTLEFNTGDKGLDRELKLRFDEETSDPEQFDIAGENTFKDFEWYASRSAKLDGDCGIVADSSADKVQFFEAHSIYHEGNTDNIVNGVKLDEFNRRVSYFIAADKPNAYDTTRQPEQEIQTRDEYGTRQFFHIYNSPRLPQARGITALAPIFEAASMLEDINIATLVKQQAASYFAIIEIGNGAGQSLPSAGPFTNTTETGANNESINVANPDGPGVYYRVPRGSDLKTFSANIPNSEYFDQVNLIIRFISVNLGLPLMMALLDGSDSTFHGYRGALDEARRGFRWNQNKLKQRWHNPYTKWKVLRWVENDVRLESFASRSDINILSYEWTAPGFPYVEPTADANGDVLQLRNNLNSPRRIQKARGREHETVTQETVEDNTFAISKAVEAANKLNESVENDADKVHWRDLINMPTPEGVQVSQSVQSIDGSVTPDKVDELAA